MCISLFRLATLQYYWLLFKKGNEMAEKNFTDYAKTGVESTRTSTPTRSQYLFYPPCLPAHTRQGYGSI